MRIILLLPLLLLSTCTSNNSKTSREISSISHFGVKETIDYKCRLKELNDSGTYAGDFIYLRKNTGLDRGTSGYTVTFYEFYKNRIMHINGSQFQPTLDNPIMLHFSRNVPSSTEIYRYEGVERTYVVSAPNDEASLFYNSCVAMMDSNERDREFLVGYFFSCSNYREINPIYQTGPLEAMLQCEAQDFKKYDYGEKIRRNVPIPYM